MTLLLVYYRSQVISAWQSITALNIELELQAVEHCHSYSIVQ